jgi:tetratricopeptide (TPR) repeat protein
MIRSVTTAFLLFTTILIRAQNPGETLKKADVMLIDADYSGVISLVDRSLPAMKDNSVAIQLEAKKAEALVRLGQLESAEALLSASLSKAGTDPFLISVVKTSQASLYLNQGRNDLAAETIQSALDGFQTAKRDNSLEAAQAISNLGIIYLNAGQYQQAEEQLQMALSVR